MTREEKLDWLYRIKSEIMYRMPTDWATPMYEVFTEALEAFRKSQKEPCEDAISRQAVIDAIEFYKLNKHHFGFNALIDDIEALPSVNPKIILYLNCTFHDK